MATTGKINGSDLLVYVDGTAITHSTSCSISIAMATRGATTKDSAGWSESLEGLRSWSVSSDQMIALDAAQGLEEVFELLKDRDTVTVKFATDDATDRFFTGSAFITALDVNADNEETATFTVAFEGTGNLILSTT